MLDKSSLAATIGTWVAVGLALIALIGVVGPYLIIKATRTERHIALEAVHDSGGFISRGTRVSRHTTLFRTVEAPILDSKPKFGPNSLHLNTSSLNSKSPTSWVRFGLLIRAYGVKYTCGDSLRIRDETTFLPVHRLWFLVIGLLGRYSCRIGDTGTKVPQTPKASAPGPSGAQPRPLRRVGSVYGVPMLRSRTSASFYRYATNLPLYGSTGQLLRVEDESIGNCTFTGHDLADVGDIQPDILSLPRLLRLALGLLSLDEVVSYCLDDVPSKEIQEDGNENGVRGVSFEDDLTYEPVRALGRTTSDSSWVTRVQSTDPLAPGALRACGYTVLSETENWLLDYFRAFGSSQGSIHSLEEIDIDQSSAPELQNYYSMTYVPASSAWVRLSNPEESKSTRSGKDDDTWVIRRWDIQIIAKVLLDLPWSSEGYLLGGQRQSLCRKLLCSSAAECIRLLSRIAERHQYLGLKDDDEQELVALVEASLVLGSKSTWSRAAVDCFVRLETKLKSLTSHQPVASDMIGILVLTNEEFRTLMLQSARHLGAPSSPGVELSVKDSTLRTPSVFGLSQEFDLDLDKLYPKGVPGAQTVPIDMPILILSSLRACVRSLLFECTWNAKPLFDFVLGLPEVANLT
ncbi:hypothetical protein CLAIMM_05567 [Cladophialophora immunda]|nr:hypothetical protein CLAIMM_05567 [Cladophialophora immunda]